MSSRYIWVVERGGVAESYWRRKFHFRLGSSLDSLARGVIAGGDEIDPESLAVVGIDADGSAWEIVPGGMGQTPVEVVLELIATKRAVAAMPSEPPFHEPRQVLKEWLSQEEDLLSRKLRGQLSFEEEHRFYQRLQASFAALAADHPKEESPYLHYFKALVDRRVEGLSLTGPHVRYRPPSPSARLEVPRPFSKVLSSVSSLADLQAVLPPFTDGIEYSSYLTFAEERERLAEVRDALLATDEKIPLHLFNAAHEELGNAYDQYVSQMRWGIWAITPAVNSDPVAFLQSYDEFYREGQPLPWQPELAAERMLRYKVVFGLFGLAYHDLMDEFDLARSRCRTCLRPVTLGPRQHHDRLCEHCRRERKRARDRAYHAKKRIPQGASPGSRA